MAKALTCEQELRDRWMEIIISQRVGSVQDAMLKAGPIVRFVLSGDVLGIDKLDESQTNHKRGAPGSKAAA